MTVISGGSHPPDLGAIKARAAAATPAPWRWGGNTDHDDPRIEGGPRRHFVLGLMRRERTKDDRQAQDFERYMQEVEQFDPSANDGKGGYRYLTEQEIADAVQGDWLSEPNGEPRHDDRLAFINVDTKLMEYARDLSVYAVCPEATSRDDERVYRADVIGVRNPNAEFIVNARADVDALVAEVERLTSELTRAEIVEAPLREENRRLHGELAATKARNARLEELFQERVENRRWMVGELRRHNSRRGKLMEFLDLHENSEDLSRWAQTEIRAIFDGEIDESSVNAELAGLKAQRVQLEQLCRANADWIHIDQVGAILASEGDQPVYVEGADVKAVDAERLAQLFHETYERLAPDHGYRTREASAKPWAEVPEGNRGLMVATCREVLAVIERRVAADKRVLDAAKAIREALRDIPADDLLSVDKDLVDAVDALVEVEDTPQHQDRQVEVDLEIYRPFKAPGVDCPICLVDTGDREHDPRCHIGRQLAGQAETVKMTASS